MNVSENTTFHPEYIIESILFNRGMISLVAVGGFSLLFASQDYQYFEAYQFFYALSIGIGLSGIFFWILAFKMFNKRFTVFYKLWLICCLFEVLFFCYILIESVNQRYIHFSVSGIIIGLITPMILTETFLNFQYKTIILARVKR